MNDSKRIRLCRLGLSFVPLVAATFSCGLCARLPIPFSSTPEAPTAGSEPASRCTVPDVVRLDQAAAQASLAALGLTVVTTEAHDDAVAAGLVIALDPPPGTWLEPCQGQVTVVISQGPLAAEVSPTRPARLPPDAELPPDDDLPMFFTTMYEETFEIGIGGFRPEWSVDAPTDPGNSYATENGELVTDGYVAAYVGDSGWFNYRVTFGGAEYAGIETFHVLTRVQDERNYVGMECFLSEGWLACEGYKVVDGVEGPVPGFQQTTRMCAVGQIQCDIAFEAIGDKYRVLVNGEQQAGFTDGTWSQGGVGFVVDGRWVLDYLDVVNPGSPAMAQFTLFRDDFDVNGWSTGSTEDEYASVNQTISDGRYVWDVRAGRDVVIQEIRQMRGDFTPVDFPYHFSLSMATRLVGGPEGAAYGLLFRCVDYDNLYYFRVEEGGDAGLYVSESGEWTELVGPVQTDVLVPGQENVLRVVAEGARFSFWINGEYVFQASDDRLAMGDIGMAVELMDAGDQVVIEFDDVQVGIPYD